MTPDPAFWDNEFLGTAWVAFAATMADTGKNPPDSDRTKRMANEIYEGRYKGAEK
jgi:hypothetical protein